MENTKNTIEELKAIINEKNLSIDVSEERNINAFGEFTNGTHILIKLRNKFTGKAENYRVATFEEAKEIIRFKAAITKK